MSTSLIPDEVQLSPEVLDLAPKLGVSAELPKVLEMTRDVFPGARLEFAIDEAPEIEDEVCLAIVVRTNIEDGVERYRKARPWHRRIFECVDQFQASAFRLHTGWHR